MTVLSYQIATEDDLREIVPWVIEVGRTPEHHCMHSWAGEPVAAVVSQFRKYMADGELIYVFARSDESIVAAMGCEFDQGLGRGWFHGPHISAEPWDSFALEIQKKVTAALPDSIVTFDAFLNVKNDRAIKFYRAQGFEQVTAFAHEYRMLPSQRPGKPKRSYGTLQKSLELSFLALYQELFPNAPYSGPRLLQMIGSGYQAFIAAEGDDVTGYVVVSVDERGTTGIIEYLGVRKTHTGRGLGRDLLLTGVNWLFDEAGVSEIGLNVRDELSGPRRLYESVGFELRFTGVPLRRERTQQGTT